MRRTSGSRSRSRTDWSWRSFATPTGRASRISPRSAGASRGSRPLCPRGSARARRPATPEAADRVRLAAGHWKPRFVANGIDANDFDRVLSETVEWRDWAPNWMRVGDEHRAIADEAERSGHL